jgi:hypothetical protein
MEGTKETFGACQNTSITDTLRILTPQHNKIQITPADAISTYTDFI